ncbi:MAG: hypothetical protein EXS17_04385 [Phycisphaerales bacterium]|nr:hypothetical protein [Phycisphaerales bacterium]
MKTSALLIVLSFMISGCGGGDGAADSSPSAATTPRATSPKPAAGLVTPAAPITVDLNKIASDLGAAYKTRATCYAKMTKGQTLDAAQSTEFYKAMESCAQISQDICDLMKKNPRWQRQITEALEKNTKSSIIALTKGEKAYAKAKTSGKVGGAGGPCPANIAATISKYQMSEMRVKGLMPYTKAEME